MLAAGIEAVKTTASAGEIWGICAVAIACLAFWLSMINWADRNPRYKHRQVPDMPGPVLGGIHLAAGGRSVAPNRDAPAVLTEAEEEAEEEYRRPEFEMAGAGATARAGVATAAPAEAGTPSAAGASAEAGRFIPGQRKAGAPPAAGQAAQPQEQEAGQPGTAETVPDMPAQRTGEADRAERSVHGPADQPDDEY